MRMFVKKLILAGIISVVFMPMFIGQQEVNAAVFIRTVSSNLAGIQTDTFNVPAGFGSVEIISGNVDDRGPVSINGTPVIFKCSDHSGFSATGVAKCAYGDGGEYHILASSTCSTTNTISFPVDITSLVNSGVNTVTVDADNCAAGPTGFIYRIRITTLLPTCTLTASSVYSSGTPRLSWTTQNAVSGSISGGIGAVTPIESGNVDASPISSPTTYTMTVSDGIGGTGSCSAAANVMECKKGLVPCGRHCDVNPAITSYDESEPCTLCHLILMTQLIMDFLFKIAAVVAAFFIAVSGVMYLVAAGRPEMMTLAKTTLKLTLLGFSLIFIAWIMVDTILTMFGYIDPLGDGSWHIMC